MDKKLIQAILGCLFHDIGKPIQRATGEHKVHSIIGEEFMEQVLDRNTLGDDVLEIYNAIRYHHFNDFAFTSHGASNNLRVDAPAYISYIADNIASSIDRRTETADDKSYHGFDSDTSLRSVYDVLKSPKTTTFYEPKMLSDTDSDLNLPQSANPAFSQSSYGGIKDKLEKQLQTSTLSESYINSVLGVLESTLSYVPSSTSRAEVADISLFDHMKLTAAIGTAIFHYLSEQKITDYKAELFDGASGFYQKEAFSLVAFDLSGLQDFIYTITSENAAKTLQSRSFYLEILTESIIDEMLSKLNLSRSSLLYSGGASGYILAPNLQNTVITVKTFTDRVNAFLLKNFRSALFFAASAVSFPAALIMKDGDPEKYAELYCSLSHEISAKKLARYTAETIKNLNNSGKTGGKECVICHSLTENDAEPRLCDFCKSLLKLTEAIRNNKILYSLPSKSPRLPLFNDRELSFGDIENVRELLKDGDKNLRAYAINKFTAGDNFSVKLWAGNYSSGSFSDHALNSAGIKRLGALRLDVDNLSVAFARGFLEQEDGKYNTLSRSATFSRSLGLFFKHYINTIAENPHYFDLTNETKEKRDLSIIYSGGDDAFVVGSWNDCLEFALELEDNFQMFTNEKLTISAGFGMYEDKYPVSAIARETGELEDAAKSKDSNKNKIAIFSEDFVFAWKDLRSDIIGIKLTEIKKFFGNNDAYGKAFIYKLIELIRSKKSEQKGGSIKTISFARWAYFLARMEPRENEEEYKAFCKQLKDWFDDKNESEKLSLALYLYVYLIRDTKGEK